LRGVQSPQLRRLVIPNVFMGLVGAMFLADGLSTDGAETLNPFEIVPGVVFLAGAVWNLFLTYVQVYRHSEKTSEGQPVAIDHDDRPSARP
jgi:hypothetical protein